jgi:large subunit ribosomal protein L20
MARVKRGVQKKKRKRRLFKAVKGFWGRRKSTYRTAREALNRAMAYSTRDRKVRAREFRKLWIIRINAACRGEQMSYSSFIGGLAAGGVKINRKMLAQLAVEDPSGLDFLLREVKAGAGQDSAAS